MTQNAWELVYQDSDHPLQRSRHDTREAAVAQLADHLLDAGVTVLDDPSAPPRAATVGDYRAEFTTGHGTRIRYAIQRVKLPQPFLSITQVAEHLGVAASTLSRYKLPSPDATIGTTRGWTPETIDNWNASRPGRGARTDLTW